MEALNATYTTAAMRRLWQDQAVLATMLHFEAELAAAQAECGVIPKRSAEVIGQVCATLNLDPWQIGTDAQRSGTLAIPLVKHLKAAVAAQDPEAAPRVHFGATSQDIADTALVLILHQSLDLLLADLIALGDALAALTEAHGDTPLLARTLLQPAAPISFGWKAAGWLDAVARCVQALRQQRHAVGVLQLGGANGTLLVHGDQGAAVLAALARRLQLQTPDITWHGARDRLARLAAELAITCGVLGKFGRDVSLLMQPEVGEAFEPSGQGRGGSSAMPHKRNPVASMHMLDAAYRAPALAQILCGELPAEHERGLGSWPNAMPTLETLFGLSANSAAAAKETAQGLRVDAAAMQHNIDRLQGVVYSEALNAVLAQHLGTARAAEVLADTSRQALAEHRPMLELLGEHAELAGRIDRTALLEACAPAKAFVGARPMMQNVLQRWRLERQTPTPATH